MAKKKDIFMIERERLNNLDTPEEREKLIKNIQKVAPQINRKAQNFRKQNLKIYNTRIRNIGYHTGQYKKLVDDTTDDIKLKYGKKVLNNLTTDELIKYNEQLVSLHQHETLKTVKAYQKDLSERYDTDNPDKRLVGALRKLKIKFGEEMWNDMTKEERDKMLFTFVDRLTDDSNNSHLSSDQVGEKLINERLEYLKKKADEHATDIVEDYKQQQSLRDTYKNVLENKHNKNISKRPSTKPVKKHKK